MDVSVLAVSGRLRSHPNYTSSICPTAPGHHMYVDSVYAKHFQEVAKLTSPMTTVPMSGCLSFYYHRDQERGNMFLVFTRDQLGHYEEIWRPEVYTTPGWSLVYVDIKAPHPLEVSRLRLEVTLCEFRSAGQKLMNT